MPEASSRNLPTKQGPAQEMSRNQHMGHGLGTSQPNVNLETKRSEADAKLLGASGRALTPKWAP
eukprot:5775777-Alexandrium_andersonii.AAC.1